MPNPPGNLSGLALQAEIQRKQILAQTQLMTYWATIKKG